MRSVMAMAMTPSANVSRRAVSIEGPAGASAGGSESIGYNGTPDWAPASPILT